MLKRVLSSEALKLTKDATSQDFRRQHKDSVIDLAATNLKTNQEHDDRLLQQLVSEQDSKFMAQVEEVFSCHVRVSFNLFAFKALVSMTCYKFIKNKSLAFTRFFFNIRSKISAFSPFFLIFYQIQP